MRAVELGLAILGLGEQPVHQAKQVSSALLWRRIASDLAADIAVGAAKIDLETPDLTAHTTVMSGMAIALHLETGLLGETEIGLP